MHANRPSTGASAAPGTERDTSYQEKEPIRRISLGRIGPAARLVCGVALLAACWATPLAAITISIDNTQSGGTFDNTGGGALVITHSSNDPTLKLASGANTSNIEAVVVGSKNGESGNLRLTSGRTLTNSGSGSMGTFGSEEVIGGAGYIGLNAGSTGTATVGGGTGGGSTWTNSTQLRVGHSGDGTLLIDQGGSVSNTFGLIGFNNGSTGNVTVTGGGSTWTNTSNLLVGQSGEGTLLIDEGGSVSNVTGFIGTVSGSTGDVTVIGGGSTWTNSEDLILGGTSLTNATTGSGELTIAAGGTVNVSGTTKAHAGGTINLQDGGTLETNHFDFADGTFNFTGGTLAATGSVTGSVTVPDGGLVTGTGTYDDLVIAAGGAVSPGFSPETISAATGEWEAGGKYIWEINALASDGGAAGSAVGWDLLEYTSSLNVGATVGDPFTVELHSLDEFDAAGLLDNFDPSLSHSWQIATAVNGPFSDLDGLAVDAAGFLNDLAGGSFGLAQAAGGAELLLEFNPAPPLEAIWNDTNGNWNDAGKWSTTNFPNNGNGGATYNATIGSSNVTLTEDITIEGLTFIGGNINGTETLTLNAPSTWTGGSVGVFVGGTKLLFLDELVLSGSNTKGITSTIETRGGVVMTGGNVFLNTGRWNNAAGTFDFQDDADFSFHSTARFDNSGTVVKSGGTGETLITVQFNNNGMLHVQSGTVSLDRGGTSTGDFLVDAGTTLRFGNAGAMNVNGGSFSGDGTVSVTDGQASLILDSASTYTITNTQMESGKFTTNADITLQNLAMSGGRLNGNADITVTNPTTWSGGQLGSGGGTKVIFEDLLTMSGGAQKEVISATVETHGGVEWSGGNLALNTSTFRNVAGTFDMQGDLTIAKSNGEPTFVNNGTFVKSAGAGIGVVQTRLNNNGTLHVQSGTVSLDRGGTSTGDFLVDAGTTLRFGNAGAMNVNGGSFSGDGTVSVTDGQASLILDSASTYTITNTQMESGKFTTNADITLQNLAMSGGTLDGNADVTVVNPADWTGGTFGSSFASGTKVIFDDLLTMSGGLQKGVITATVETHGGANWSGGTLALNTSTFRNVVGTFDMQGDLTIAKSNGEPTFVNNGTFVKSAGAGIGVVQTNFTNNGTVDVQSGTLRFDRGYTHNDAHLLVNGGTIASGSELQIPGGTIGGAGTIDADVRLTGDAVLIPGASPGVLNVTGDLFVSETSFLEFEFAGLTAGSQYDVLNVSGDVNLEGTVVLEFIEDFAPSQGQFFDFLFADGAINFAQAVFELGDLSPEFDFDVALVDDHLRLTALSDAAGLNAIPEPGTLTLLAIFGVGGLVRRRSRRKSATDAARNHVSRPWVPTKFLVRTSRLPVCGAVMLVAAATQALTG